MNLALRGNAMDRERFRRWYRRLSILLFPVYLKWFRSFSMRLTELVQLVLLAIMLGWLFCRTSERRSRNLLSLLTGAPAAYLLSEALSLGTYVKAIRTGLAIFGAVLLVFCAAWAFLKARAMQTPRLRRNAALCAFFSALRLLLCAGLLAGCIYGKQLFRAQQTVLSGQDPNPSSSAQSEENTLAANLATIAKLEPEVWSESTDEEKLEILQTIARVECRYLGMTGGLPEIRLSYLEDGLAGMYTDDTDTVTLSYAYMLQTGASGYACVQVLCHELYHRYQHQQVRLLEAIAANSETAPYEALLLFDRASVYRSELADYRLPDGADGSLEAYRSQLLERDAERYANGAAADYYQQVQDYLED